MSEQYSEDAKHIEKLYEFDERLSESTDKSQNVQDYEGIIELSKTNIKTKQLGAQLIPRYFKFFTSLATEAFDAYLDIFDEVEVGVRVQAIRGLPLFCKDTPDFISKIIDVLVQCLNTEEFVERDAVHKALMSLFRQDTKASLTALFKHTEATLSTDEQIREKVLHFIRDKVFPLKGELLKPQQEMERHITDLIKKVRTYLWLHGVFLCTYLSGFVFSPFMMLTEPRGCNWRRVQYVYGFPEKFEYIWRESSSRKNARTCRNY
jgi:hypothetical protein